MQIQQLLPLIQVELKIGNTPKGNPLQNFARQSLEATISDKDNYDAEATRCQNCGLIVSSLLVSEGCPQCGGLDLTTEIQ